MKCLPRVSWNMGTTFWWEPVFLVAQAGSLSVLKPVAAEGQTGRGCLARGKAVLQGQTPTSRWEKISVALNALIRGSWNIKKMFSLHPWQHNANWSPAKALRSACCLVLWLALPAARPYRSKSLCDDLRAPASAWGWLYWPAMLLSVTVKTKPKHHSVCLILRGRRITEGIERSKATNVVVQGVDAPKTLLMRVSGGRERGGSQVLPSCSQCRNKQGAKEEGGGGFIVPFLFLLSVI